MLFYKTIGQKINYVDNCFAKSISYFFFIILSFKIIPNMKIKIFEKHIFAKKKSQRLISNFK